MTPSIALDEFTEAYIEAALWSTQNEEPRQRDGEYLESNYSVADFVPEAMTKIITDCTKFQLQNEQVLDAAECNRGTGNYSKYAQAGHDFWFTRNGHGVGFWEEDDWPAPHGTALDEAASKFGECWLYVGDDGRLYLT